MLEANSEPFAVKRELHIRISAIIETADYKRLVTDFNMELLTCDANIASPKHKYYKIN